MGRAVGAEPNAWNEIGRKTESGFASRTMLYFLNQSISLAFK